MRMNSEMKERWVYALRSGVYPQTHGRLRRVKPSSFGEVEVQPGFCCLGVLCDLYDPDRWVNHDGEVMMWHDSYTKPAPEMMEELGLTWEDEQELIGMNDEKKMTFDQIADWIEKYL